MAGRDERLPSAGAHGILADSIVFRCSACGISFIESPGASRGAAWRPHQGCAGVFERVLEPLPRAILLRLMSRVMLGKGCA